MRFQSPLVYEMEQFKVEVGRCFALIYNQLGVFDLFVTGRSHFLLCERSLSFNNVMITLTSARRSARILELASGIDRCFVRPDLILEGVSATRCFSHLLGKIESATLSCMKAISASF